MNPNEQAYEIAESIAQRVRLVLETCLTETDPIAELRRFEQAILDYVELRANEELEKMTPEQRERTERQMSQLRTVLEAISDAAQQTFGDQVDVSVHVVGVKVPDPKDSVTLN